MYMYVSFSESLDHNIDEPGRIGETNAYSGTINGSESCLAMKIDFAEDCVITGVHATTIN